MGGAKVVQCAYCHQELLRRISSGQRHSFCDATCRRALGRMTFTERFWTKVQKTKACWLWTAAHRPNESYGHVWQDGLYRGAHRVAWELTTGSIPDGLHVLHICDTPLCVRPDHLFLGTNKENSEDMCRKGRHRTVNPFAKGEGHPLAKMTWEKVRQIRAFYDAKTHPPRELAVMFGIARSTLYWITSRTTWQEEEVPSDPTSSASVIPMNTVRQGGNETHIFMHRREERCHTKT